MRARCLTPILSFTGALLALASLSSGCALLEKKKPVADVAPAGPLRVSVPHPETMDVKEIRAIFMRRGAPDASVLDRCDFDYRVESKLAPSKEGLFTTFPADVKANPDLFHWCFYGRLLRILDLAEATQDNPDRAGEVKKLILQDYPFLTHLARIFEADFQDVRYLRTAIYHYRILSRRFFYTSTEPSERTQGLLMDSVFPNGLPAAAADPAPSPSPSP